MSEIEIEVDGFWTERPAPENIRKIRVKEKNGVITVKSTDKVGTQYLMIPEEDAVELADAITATVEQQNTD